MDSEKTIIVTKKEQEIITKLYNICSFKMGLNSKNAANLLVSLCNIELSDDGFDFGYIEKTGRIDKTIITKEELRALQNFYKKYCNSSYLFWYEYENEIDGIYSLFNYVCSNCKRYHDSNIKYVKKQLTNNRKYAIINI